MKRLLFAAALPAALLGAGLAFGIGPRGGGGGGGQRPNPGQHANPSLGGGHAMSRPSGGMMPQNRPPAQPSRPNPPQASRPSMQRPSQPAVQRPSQSGGLRPGGAPSGGNRPGGMLPQRPSQPGGGGAGNPGAFPGLAGTRPATLPGAGQRPGSSGQPINRPGNAIASNRPGQGAGNLNPAGPRPGGIMGGGGSGLIGSGSRPGQGGGGLAGGGIRPGAGGSGQQLPGLLPGGGTRPGQGGGGVAGGGIRPGAGGGGQQLPGLLPGGGTRPGQGGGGNQWAGWRPGDGTRPGQGGSGEQWRPGGGNRPWGDGNRPWINGNSPQPGGIWGNGSNNIVNSGNSNNFYNNQQSFINAGNRYGNVNGWGGYSGYNPGYYGNWYSGSWSNWPTYPTVWAGGVGLGALGLAAADSFTYSNPYATSVSEPVYNYSQPIPVYVESNPAQTVVVNTTPDQVPATPGLVDPSATAPAAQAPEAPSTNEDPKIKEATRLFDQARELFKHADYDAAQKKVDEAIGVLPQDRALHEFRALVLFAQKEYPKAASTLYAVLASGPGWNWDTQKSFYPDVDTYTRQLRALEADARDKPKSPDDRFVLAYHYFVLGQTDAAVKELEVLTQLLPDDKLSAQILSALKPKPASSDDRPTATPG